MKKIHVLKVVEKQEQIPQYAGRRNKVTRGDTVIHYRATETYKHGQYEDSLMCCGLELSRVDSTAQLTAEQMIYLAKRIRGQAVEPMGDKICIWKSGDKVAMAVGMSDVLFLDGEKPFQRDELYAAVEKLLEHA